METFHLFTLKTRLLLHIYFQKKTLCTLLLCTFNFLFIYHGAKFDDLKIKHWGGSGGGGGGGGGGF
jgi:hypothetical protein